MDEYHRKLTEAANEGCLLRRLSAELRNEVYYLVLPTNTVIDTRGEKTYSESKHYFNDNPPGSWWTVDDIEDGPKETLRNQVAITQTCRALRSDTLSIYYGSNRFVVHVGAESQRMTMWQLHEAKSWVRSRPQAAVALLREVILSVPRTSLSKRISRYHPLAGGPCNHLVQVNLAANTVTWRYHQVACLLCKIEQRVTKDYRESLAGTGRDNATKQLSLMSAIKADVGNDPAPTT